VCRHRTCESLHCPKRLGLKQLLSPTPPNYCDLDPAEKPRLVVVVDTEEEFDWSGDFSRNETTVRSMRSIGRVQNVFDEYRITPVYVVDYPVANQPEGQRPLEEIHSAGRCLIGAHLHPWVNPPFDETVNRRNSFPGNLPPKLEAAKLRALGDAIEEHFGTRPKVYKAGRYGIGPHTAETLEQQHYEVDMSVCPRMDYSGDEGPDFTNISACPFWFGKSRLLELPLTVGFAGPLRRWGIPLHRIASHRVLARLHAVGVLARLGVLDKIWLCPEGYLSDEHKKLVRSLHSDGLRIFSFAFHSPSLEPGNTPYVRSLSDLESFISRCRKFFDFFLGDLSGIAATPLEIKNQLIRSTSKISAKTA
jgi:hypothetical protein